jgi:uncharacterized protein YebE (UPF0316 family)
MNAAAEAPLGEKKVVVMEWLSSMPVWLLCLLIFLLRICDVSLGTVRTVAIVRGHVTAATILGFFEVMIWILAISQVISRLQESWLLPMAFAGGFAAGNAAGIALERKLALGMSTLRILSRSKGEEIARALRLDGHGVTTFAGHGMSGPVTLVYALAPRRKARQILSIARGLDPEAVSLSDSSEKANVWLQPLAIHAHLPTGWRAVFKKK